MACHIQINNIAEFFYFDTIKIFVLIISGKISGKCSGKLPTGIFNQLSDAILTKKIIFLAIMSRFNKVNL